MLGTYDIESSSSINGDRGIKEGAHRISHSSLICCAPPVVTLPSEFLDHFLHISALETTVFLHYLPPFLWAYLPCSMPLLRLCILNIYNDRCYQVPDALNVRR